MPVAEVKELEEVVWLLEGRSGVLIGRSMVTVVPPCDSPAIWRGGVPGISMRPSSSLSSGVSTLPARSALSLAASALSASSAAVSPRASALP